MVSDQEIANCVESLLRQPDPSGAGVTVTGVVQQLEAKLGLPLSHKADFIKEKIGALLRPPPPLHHQQQLQLQQQFQLQQQQQYYFAQQQMAAAAAAAVQSSSPFTHLPQRHELAFRCAPPPMQMQQHQHQHQVAAAAMGAAGVQRQEVQFSPGVSVPPAANAKGSQPAVKRRGGPGGLSKVCGVSPELQAIVGEPALPRTQIVKQLWAYIRKNNLQDPNNKRKIICNDELRLVFETDSTDMFKMNKLLAKHIIALEPTKESAPNSKRQKASDVSPSVVSPSVESETAEYPVAISNALAGFFGTEEREMLQSEALKRVWDYIKENQLEDSVNTTISCDAKLQELFGCESLSSADVSEMVSRHLFKQS